MVVEAWECLACLACLAFWRIAAGKNNHMSNEKIASVWMLFFFDYFICFKRNELNAVERKAQCSVYLLKYSLLMLMRSSALASCMRLRKLLRSWVLIFCHTSRISCFSLSGN